MKVQETADPSLIFDDPEVANQEIPLELVLEEIDKALDRIGDGLSDCLKTTRSLNAKFDEFMEK